MTTAILTIGTRGSPLALAQTHEVRRLLAAALGAPEEALPIEIIRTTGDMIQDRPLAESGGKGLFTRELDIALAEGRIDLAVHSSKDLPTHLPPEIAIAGFLPREDVRDAWIGRGGASLADLPQGAVVGTASLRRGAQVKRLRPDVSVTLLRGNVETRLHKVESGEVDGTLLALAGLKRLGLADKATAILPLEDFLPAAGQGAIAITKRAGDARTRDALAPILDAATGAALAAERAFLTVLDGSCRTPIAAHARVDGDAMEFHGLALRADGSEIYEARRRGAAIDAARLGDDAANEILLRLPHGVAGLS
ncbi:MULTISPECIES: hydroxymethylbilane synthase [Methylosinus]|uniref:Porphobilinogen deaminase n=1 Tax=Methylosinus trichosporium (strain ATCC 35070 / NCIMB 11131 / UNIQEM 75 / OB3b) TaxID=595536 RepID=A0A2D2CY62_METT3|nr:MULTISPECIES: hydroxymethylbilane synthase [Methylosinus]ATQ67579.1 hydroxymethylbilane synthase [Methylosinus trichosporium OB3b]OBS52122.1 hydroxymethylbilane synthase [Methylosinus sp. 3S-1]